MRIILLQNKAGVAVIAASAAANLLLCYNSIEPFSFLPYIVDIVHTMYLFKLWNILFLLC